MTTSNLPPELISLVHHVELNKAGWWNRAIQHLILSALWTSTKPLTVAEITEVLRVRFKANIDDTRVQKQVDLACSSGIIVCLPGEQFKISESFSAKFEGERAEVEGFEKTTAVEFQHVIEKHCPELDGAQTWRDFNERFLLPLVREVGANTYRLLSQRHPHLDPARFERFVEAYPSDVRGAFSDALEEFFTRGDVKLRAYLLRSLTAFFLIESTSLSEETLQGLTRFAESRPTFNLFLDTNYLFSILDLTASTDTNAVTLNEILGQLHGRLAVKLYALPITIDEAKRVLISTKRSLGGLRPSPNLAEAALKTRINSIQLRYFDEVRRSGSITAEDYFNPYIEDFLAIMRAKGVELYNEDTSRLNTRQDVIDDLMARLEMETRRYHDEGKTYEQLEHDIVLWHFVHDRRPRELESPIEARNWIVTLDYRLLGHDEYKQRVAKTTVPICLHPTSVMQMFQFWIPRTQQFEAAMFDSMRLPFFGRGFDQETEKVTVEILKALSRFEDIGDLQANTVSSILVNRALRQTISTERDDEEKIKLVRDALIQQHQKTEQELLEARQKAEQIQKQANEKHQTLDEALRTRELQTQNLETKIAQLEEASRIERDVLEGRIQQLEAGLQTKLVDERTRNAREASRDARRYFLFLRFLIPLLAVIALGIAISYVLNRVTGLPFVRCFVAVIALGLLVLSVMVERLGGRQDIIKTWQWFIAFQTIRRWIWGFLGAILLGVLGNAVYEWLKQQV